MGAGIHGVRPRRDYIIPLGKCSTIFQAETHAIMVCIQKNLECGYMKKHIYILSGSQSALKALNSIQIKSKLVWDCLQNLIELAKHNKVTLMWVPGHRGIEGNVKGDQLARQASETLFTGPEPVHGISKNRCRTLIDKWIKRRPQQYWDQTVGQIHSKVMVGHPNRTLTADLLNRTKARIIVGLLTGHCGLRKHLNTMGVRRETVECRLCDEEEETASHIIFDCDALSRRRQNSPETGMNPKNLINRLLNLIKGTNLFE
ncbi:hypothetical protein JTB14_005847 [Gonioctena quinquepunctata]|nr:hypothetical protein JTB14_005847 [Gonioctena quinquepunctata]